MGEMQEEQHRPKRQTLDRMYLPQGAKIRVYFPYDKPPLVMTATGNSRDQKSRMSEHEYEFQDDSGKFRWVPGWYIAQNA